MTVAANKETLGFETEVKQILDLMIHSLYSDKEIFLRELISNASDACDKLRFETVSDASLMQDDADLNIRIKVDKDKRTVSVIDNGVGMSRDEVIANIGTIARSGTKTFFESLTGDQAKDSHLIGQFGVGFYSAFIVADEVTVLTRRAGQAADTAVKWQSKGDGEYTLENIEREQRGTEVILHIRKDMDEFLEALRLQTIARKYSDHISLPILMKKDDSDEDDTINKAAALWARPKKDITEEEHNEFYKHISHDFEDPLVWTHNHVEGRNSYTSLLYIPKRAPYDLWDKNSRHGIKLYVRRVFIMDDAEQLLPEYLRFVRGVIDSNDLPLNVSREMLQRDKFIDAIRTASIKRILGVLENLASKKPEKYADFWKEFGAVLKEGVMSDYEYRDRIVKLLRFSSTKGDGKTQSVSLDDYVARMQEGQDKIYYVTGDSYNAAINSPHLEIFRDKDIEVIVLHDRIDEWLVNHVTEHDGKQLQSVTRGALNLGDLAQDKEKAEKAEGEYKDLLEKAQATLGDKVKEVRITHRLTKSPACLVADENDMGANMQRILSAVGQAAPMSKPILELNPDHDLIIRLRSEGNEKRFEDWVSVLFDQALLAEGGQLEDPASYVSRMNDLLLELSSK
ncbi:MAG: molecular chaperone HtpG [Gammaproteobacteria bacterium]|nr:molecular chaperone HtpG [bacterium AH-315-E07]PCH61064.1 MAG: molecular chaperone HtpG [Gammaproteobacteria bacterium]